jgi:hypothetical protein
VAMMEIEDVETTVAVALAARDRVLENFEFEFVGEGVPEVEEGGRCCCGHG